MRIRSIVFAVLGVVADVGAARAAETPLLVSVEIAPGVDVNSGEVRQVIAAELGMRVASARETGAIGSADILLVTVEPHQIRMSLRAGTVPTVSRTIAASGDRPARLRSIGWLAGNLARDQVGPLVVTAPVFPPELSAMAGARGPTEPPALAETPPPDSGSPAAVVAARGSRNEGAALHARWSISASGGPTLKLVRSSEYVDRGTVYEIDVHRQSAPDSLLFGAALEVGPGSPNRHYFSLAGVVGTGWRRRSWFLEGNLGVGLEVLDASPRVATVTITSNTGTTSDTTITLEPTALLYLRASGIAGAQVSTRFDLVAQLGAHLSSTGDAGSFLSATAGLRLRLP